MPKPKYSYDDKCAELAEHFISDEPWCSENDIRDLAQTIQDAVEGWIYDKENEPAPQEGRDE